MFLQLVMDNLGAWQDTVPLSQKTWCLAMLVWAILWSIILKIHENSLMKCTRKELELNRAFTMDKPSYKAYKNYSKESKLAWFRRWRCRFWGSVGAVLLGQLLEFFWLCDTNYNNNHHHEGGERIEIQFSWAFGSTSEGNRN